MRIKYIIIALILIAIVISGFTIYKYRQNNIIKEGNLNTYKLLECFSNCPTYFNQTFNTTIFQEVCSDECKKYKIPSEYQKINSGTLLASKEYLLCLENPNKDFVLFQKCLKEILPKVREKYKIEE